MKKKLATDEIIDSLIAATLDQETPDRQRYLLREGLRNLVRLAKSEQTVEMQSNIRRLTGAIEWRMARKIARSTLAAHRLPEASVRAQQQFEFQEKN